jgi:hypothetical protein
MMTSGANKAIAASSSNVRSTPITPRIPHQNHTKLPLLWGDTRLTSYSDKRCSNTRILFALLLVLVGRLDILYNYTSYASYIIHKSSCQSQNRSSTLHRCHLHPHRSWRSVYHIVYQLREM